MCMSNEHVIVLCKKQYGVLILPQLHILYYRSKGKLVRLAVDGGGRHVALLKAATCRDIASLSIQLLNMIQLPTHVLKCPQTRMLQFLLISKYNYSD